MSNDRNKLGQREAEASQCAAREEYTGPYHPMLHTHRPFNVWLCIAYLSPPHAEMPLREEGAERQCASIMGSEVHLYVGWVMRVETYSSATTSWTAADKCSGACWTIEQESTLHCWRLLMTCASGLCKNYASLPLVCAHTHMRRCNCTDVTAISSLTHNITYDSHKCTVIKSFLWFSCSSSPIFEDWGSYYHLVGRYPSIMQGIHYRGECVLWNEM